jgi:DNA-binding GntR family transcriptional regulator
MNPGPTLGRVYEDLRRSILDRQRPPGDHLDPAMIAGALAASTTPVREALSRLVGEGLVDTRQGAGFHVPLLDEPSLRDLYAWTSDLASLSLRAAPDILQLRQIEWLDHADYAMRTAAIFDQIASASPNCEHGRAMRNANARLHAVRYGEPEVLIDAREELDTLLQTMRSGSVVALRRSCSAFVRRRQRIAGELVRRRYRPR